MCFDETQRKLYLSIFDRIIGLLQGADNSIIELIQHDMEQNTF